MKARSRERLLHLLAEAAELEHNILCSYLYAVFSLKQREDEDLSARELAAVQRWRGDLLKLCIEEMVHLAQVSNLLVAVGARPHFDRPNLPVAPGYHPAGISIKLAPFDMETLEHFIYLERPQEAPVPDPEVYSGQAESFERAEPAFAPLMPRAPDYGTIGQFYAELRSELEQLSAAIGERRLFCGPRDRQLRADEINSRELVVVHDLAGARKAIDCIVEQGEGSGARREDSHFGRFEEMRTEYCALLDARPAFSPNRAAVRNPVMHAAVEEDRVHVTAHPAAQVIDAANAAYCAMLRCLVHSYEVGSGRDAAREPFLGAAFVCMNTVTALGTALTELTAWEDGTGRRAGMSFAVLRSTEGLMELSAAALVAERLSELADRLPTLGIPSKVFEPLVPQLRKAARACADLQRIPA